jgi:hypothetical protein
MQPSKVDNHGNKFWMLNNMQHRVDGPAAECANGDKQWWLNGKRHRVDGPAIEFANGDKYWYQNDILHRVDGPAVEYNSGPRKGEKCWWLNGKRHRDDGPAIEWADGTKQWYFHGKLHRKYAPAILNNKVAEYWCNGKRYEFSKLKKGATQCLMLGKVYTYNAWTPIVYAMVRAFYFAYYLFSCLTFKPGKVVCVSSNTDSRFDPIEKDRHIVSTVDVRERDRKYAVVTYPLDAASIDKLAAGYWERKRNRKV